MRGTLLSEVTHLVRRFFRHLFADPPSPSEQLEVASRLTPAEAELFFRQAPEDQRHAIDVAARAAEQAGDDPEVFRAALLHDVGKALVSVGAIGRSLATIVDHLGVPMPESWRRYRRHGPAGADLLGAAGAPELAVAFARHHPQPPPPGVDADRYRILLDADHV